MLKSMTGFGRTEGTVGDKVVMIDLKSLNGKGFELQLKMPAFLRPFEFSIRKAIAEGLGRGSIDCSINLKETGSAKPVTINTSLARAYYQPLAQLATELNLPATDVLGILVKLPEVITPTNETLTDAEWIEFEKVLAVAIKALNNHREEEGKTLMAELVLRINNIRQQQHKVQELEPQRQKKVREGLVKMLEEGVGKDGYDHNRLEQELIYYIEKMDITEEQVRLSNHLDYFLTILTEPEEGKGKKLSFILQEIGREINTTGAKAYDAAIQKNVVLMKDELEKAKEQVLNVL